MTRASLVKCFCYIFGLKWAKNNLFFSPPKNDSDSATFLDDFETFLFIFQTHLLEEISIVICILQLWSKSKQCQWWHFVSNMKGLETSSKAVSSCQWRSGFKSRRRRVRTKFFRFKVPDFCLCVHSTKSLPSLIYFRIILWLFWTFE